MHVFDVEVMKFTLEQLMAEVQGDFWLHCPVTEPIVERDRVRGVIVESKSGREAVLAKVVIDCTGDGDVAARAGVPFELGRPYDGLCQPMTLMFEICGYEGFRNLPADKVSVHEFMRDLNTAADEYSLELKFPYGPQRSGTPYLIATPGKAVAVIQATHVYKVDPTDARQVSEAIVEARRQVHEVFLPAMRRIPGLQNLRLAQTAPTIGVREGRRIQGRCRLDLDDLVEARRFDDAVTSTGFHLDVHEIDPSNPDDPKLPPLPEGMTRHTIPRCDIPYRCLLPEHVGGLLVAGRCISGTHVHGHGPGGRLGRRDCRCPRYLPVRPRWKGVASDARGARGPIRASELKKQRYSLGENLACVHTTSAAMRIPYLWLPLATTTVTRTPLQTTRRTPAPPLGRWDQH